MEIDLHASGKRIKAIRTRHKYSMALFAKLVGNSSASTVNNWEKGNNLPKQERLEKLAILGNTTVNWIKYGEFEEYVTALLNQNKPKQPLSPKQFEQLLTYLNKKRISYTEDLKILTAAHKLFPDLFENSYPFKQVPHQEALIAEDFPSYSIERNDRYRSEFLPIIEELLGESSKKEINAVALREVFELLQRSESSKYFADMPHIFSLIKAVTTNDISYNIRFKKACSQYVSATNKQLSKEAAAKQYQQFKEKLIDLLDNFYEEYQV
ncbi:helix-turn-helix domain-containing protein [Erwinia sp. CPCC 100877]|nr:helix-turn-helix domain-containing protein [Erwinia sp. CPCC 100877]